MNCGNGKAKAQKTSEITATQKAPPTFAVTQLPFDDSDVDALMRTRARLLWFPVFEGRSSVFCKLR